MALLPGIFSVIKHEELRIEMTNLDCNWSSHWARRKMLDSHSWASIGPILSCFREEPLPPPICLGQSEPWYRIHVRNKFLWSFFCHDSMSFLRKNEWLESSGPREWDFFEEELYLQAADCANPGSCSPGLCPIGVTRGSPQALQARPVNALELTGLAGLAFPSLLPKFQECICLYHEAEMAMSTLYWHL